MGMAEGTIVEWAVPEGGLVEKDSMLVSIETEKVVTDLPSPSRGYVRRRAGVGEAVPVETVIAQIADTETEYQQMSRSASMPGIQSTLTTPASDSRASTSVAAPPTVANGRIRVSGLARKMAKLAGISLAALTGSGPGGRIVRRDVQAALARETPKSQSVTPPVTPLTVGDTSLRERVRIPLTGVRKTIAERMVKSKTTAAHTYAFFEVDITKLVSARQAFLAREQELNARITFTTLYAKALAIACQHVPICNATMTDTEITVWDNVNVGIAVALPGKSEYESALIVPVVRDVERKGILALDREIKTLVEKARAGQLGLGMTTDGTVTLSSSAGFVPGLWGVSTPLINQPQVVNFQPGTALEKPVVVDGQIVVRTMLPCGVSFDHRAMDGEPMGRFTRKLADVLANPELMLL